MSEITLEQRFKQSAVIIKHFEEQFSISNPSEAEKILTVYNNAVDDIMDALDVFADKNLQYKLAFMSLKENLKNWRLVLPEDTDDRAQE